MLVTIRHISRGLFFSFVVLFILSIAAGAESKTITIEPGEYKGYQLEEFEESDYVYIEMVVKNNIPIDVYLMPEGQFEKYKNGEDFLADYVAENVTSLKESWKIRDNEIRFLVFDNWDNAHENDAVSNQSVRVDLEYRKDIGEIDIKEVLICFSICCLLPVGLIIVVYLLFVRKRPGPFYKSPPRFRYSQREWQYQSPYSNRYSVVQEIGEYVSGTKDELNERIIRPSPVGKVDKKPYYEQGFTDYQALSFYEEILRKAWEDGYIDEAESRMLKTLRESERISLEEHKRIEKKIVEERGITPMRCPQCGKIGDYVPEKDAYYCSDCGIYI